MEIVSFNNYLWFMQHNFYQKQARLTGHSTTLEQKRFQNFLNSMGFILNSRSLNYSMPKKGRSGVKGERISM